MGSIEIDVGANGRVYGGAPATETGAFNGAAITIQNGTANAGHKDKDEF